MGLESKIVIQKPEEVNKLPLLSDPLIFSGRSDGGITGQGVVPPPLHILTQQRPYSYRGRGGGQITPPTGF